MTVTLVVHFKRISSREAQCNPAPTGMSWNFRPEVEHGGETDDSR